MGCRCPGGAFVLHATLHDVVDYFILVLIYTYYGVKCVYVFNCLYPGLSTYITKKKSYPHIPKR